MFYEIYNGDYSKQYIERSLLSGYTQYKHKIISNLIGQIRPKRVLDVGCNINASIIKGSLRTEIEKRGIKYFGLDVDTSCFEKKSLIKLGVRKDNIYKDITGCIGDIQALPFQTESEEVIIVADVLEHVEDLNTALKELHRVLQPGGILIAVLPYFYKLDCFRLQYICEIRKSSHINKPGMTGWLRLLKKSGFRHVTKMSRSVGFLSGLCYLLWLDEKYIPQKITCGCERRTAQKNCMQADLKEFLTRMDEVVDPLISTKIHMLYLNMLYKGEFLEMAKKIEGLLKSISIPAPYDQLVTKFLDALSSTKMRPNEETQIQTECKRLMDKRFGIGNAHVFVLEKQL